MSADRWIIRPRKDGAVDVELQNLGGKSLRTIVKPDELSTLIAGLCGAFRSARLMAGHPEAPSQYEGHRVPVTPDGVGLLHPLPNKSHLVVLVGEAHVVIDISYLDIGYLARMLLAASAGSDRPQ